LSCVWDIKSPVKKHYNFKWKTESLSIRISINVEQT
jgi:hypothetical protein